MSINKTAAQVRGDLLADIEAVRLGRMPKETAAVIFAGYKEVNASMNTEVAIFKASLLAKQHGVEFARSVRFGRREVNGEDDAEATA
jgi:hypothetical protein